MIDYQAASNIANELRAQYEVQKQAGYTYAKEEQLDGVFFAQAAKLASQGVTSLADIGQSSWTRSDGKEIRNLVNKRTGDLIYDVSLYGDWQNDPTSFRIKQTRNAQGDVVNKPIELKQRDGYEQWGVDLSVPGKARYGIEFSGDTPVFTPYWKDTKNFDFSDAVKTAAAIAAAYYGGQYLLGGEAAGAAYNPMSGAEFAFASEAAPIVTATAVPAEQLAYPSTQVGAGATPVPGSYQARLADLGVQTAATTPPATAAAGSFQAALPSLLSAGGTAGLSLLDGLKAGKDILDVANAVDSLLNPPSNQIQPGQQQQPIARPQSQFSLPAPQQTVVGLLPLAERYRRSLI